MLQDSICICTLLGVLQTGHTLIIRAWLNIHQPEMSLNVNIDDCTTLIYSLDLFASLHRYKQSILVYARHASMLAAKEQSLCHNRLSFYMYAVTAI